MASATPTPREVFDFFVSQGLAPHQAAAMVGHMMAESGGDPTKSHDSGTGYGLFGWRNPDGGAGEKGKGRWADLLRFAKSGTGVELDPNDWKTQALFALRELDTTEKAAGAKLYAARTYDDAVNAGMHFLRPAGYRPDSPTAGHNYTGRYNLGAQLAGVQPLMGDAVAAAGGGVAPAVPPGGGLLSPPPAPTTPPTADRDPYGALMQYGYGLLGQAEGAQPNFMSAPPIIQGRFQPLVEMPDFSSMLAQQRLSRRV